VLFAGGIGEVSTNPDYRSRGLASKLLDMAVKYCQDKKWPIMQLHTGKQAPFYASQGWIEVPIHNNTLVCQIQGNPAAKGAFRR
jgi:predicted acetyltransferase